MLGRWVRHLLWRPFELGCRIYPLLPMRAVVTQPVPGVTCIRINNVITRALSRFGGGYDYAVCYWVDDTLLVDTGFPWARRCLRQVLIELGADKKLRRVVNTHYHEDHTGNNDLLAKLTGAEILAHPLAVPEIRFPPSLPWYRHFLFGPVPSVEVRPIGARLHTSHFEFEVHHLPGHCPGHICLFEPRRRWLFSGDLYIAADLDSQLTDANGPEWIESLNKAIALAPACLFDAHGVILTGENEVMDLLVRKRNFLCDLQRRILVAAQQAGSIREITRRVFNRQDLVDRFSFSDGWLSLLTGSDFSRGNLVKSFLREASIQNAERSQKDLSAAVSLPPGVSPIAGDTGMNYPEKRPTAAT
jgi:glyoxylase-like metal-dependent hydrolase (beta-lactamase superfamily II)